MWTAERNLIRIARHVGSLDPILAYELERSVIALAVINPNVDTIEGKIERTIAVLKSMRQELQEAEDLKTAEEFADFFEAGLPEIEELDRIMKGRKTAGIKDWFKGKGKKEKPSDDSPGMSPSYKMTDEESDAFVEGKGDWDSGKSIEKEKKQNDEFFADVTDVTRMVDKGKKNPSKQLITRLLELVDDLIERGGKLLGQKPASKEPTGPEARPKEPIKAPSGKKKEPKKVPDLMSKVQHFVDMLQKSHYDEEKTTQILRNFFREIKPAIESERADESVLFASALPALVRTAHTYPRLRPHLLPFIRRIAKR